MGGGGSRRYDWETKVAAARDHVENGLTKAEVMAMHGIASVTPLERWCREYRSGGPEALGPRPKGVFRQVGVSCLVMYFFRV